MALQTKVWKDLKSYPHALPDIIVDGVDCWPQLSHNSIAISYKGGELVLPNTYIVDTIEIEE